MKVQAELYQGDCIEIMQSIPDESVDMILCDLPYGTTKNAWDTLIPFDALWMAYGRIIKPHGAIILFSQQPFTAELIMSNKKMFRYEWIWQKANATGFLNAKKMPLKCHENILVFYKKLPVYNPQMRTGFKPYRIKSGKQSKNYGEQTTVETVSNGERYPIDIIQFAGVNMMDGAKTEHPTQKPVDLLEYLIRTYSVGGDTILDNCMGSGSTGVAALATQRNFIGVEQDPEFFEIAYQRINKVQKALFGTEVQRK